MTTRVQQLMGAKMGRSLCAGALLALLAISARAGDTSAARLPSDQRVPSFAATTDYVAPILAGISNQKQNEHQPYVTAGDRTYLIGTQDGNFPDMGHHVPGEMAGLWLPPIKLLDGFQARLEDVESGTQLQLAESAEMVAYPYGSLFRYGRVLDNVDVERFQFAPDHHPGLIVQYRFRNASERARRLRLQWSVKTDLRPGWYADHNGVQDAQDIVDWRPDSRMFIARDLSNSWFCVWGAASPAQIRRVEHPDPIQTAGQGVTAASSHTVIVGAHASATLTFVIAGSTTNERDAVESFRYLAAHHRTLLGQKVAHYASIINRARITIPDQRLQQVYNWARIDMEWLVRDVPGVGRGLSGGFMEYPWWFGTETYSLQALTASGDYELAKQTLRLLRDRSYQVNGNGRIVHEITTDGQVANPGNTQETAQFIMTVGKIFQWTGDRNFAIEMYPAIKRGIDWLLSNTSPDNPFPQGYGITEILGLNAGVIDVAVYTQQALEAAALIAAAMHDAPAELLYRKAAAQLKQQINQRFWIDADATYGDFYASRAQAISTVEGAIKQVGLKSGPLNQKDQELIGHYEQLKTAFAAQPEGERAWITNKNWVIATPLETGIAPRARALPLLDKIRRENTGQYGPYLSAVARQAMMTISTGVQAVAEAHYGRTDEALWYVDKIVATFNRVSPGSISEMMPDYGCFAIAWTSYGIVLPLIEHVFGIHPDAPNKTITFEPHPPSGWKDFRIEELPIGDNVISLSHTKTAKGVLYEIRAKEDGWQFILKEQAAANNAYVLNGRSTQPSSAGIRMGGRKNQLLISSGSALH
ncbi:MAG: hypothetical protein JOZ12_04035 [Sinobacteraceae bacterium]|nr:hypothetical protein [Nevskiaceae bacterium]